MKCDHNCLECTRKDCDNDDITFEELARYREEDKENRRESELMRNDLSRQRRWDLLNPDRTRANKHRHYMENREVYAQRRKAYYESHKEEILEKQKIYIEKNRELIKVRQRESKRRRYSENPDYYRQKQREYRARKKAEKQKAQQENREDSNQK